MRFRPATPADRTAIAHAQPQWWDGRDLTGLLHEMFFANFGSTSVVAEDDSGRMVGFLLGFPSVDDPSSACAFVIGVDPEARGRSLGRELYRRFDEAVGARGVRVVRCMTSRANHGSIAFHHAIGFSVESMDEHAVRFVRTVDPQRRRRIDPRPHDSAWPQAMWPVPEGTVLERASVRLSITDPVSDSDGIFAALDDDAVWTHVRGRPGSREDMRVLLAGMNETRRYPWTVRRGGKIVGMTSFLEVEPADARLEIGFTVYSPDVWGTEVNPTCKLLLMTWAFETARMGRVQLKADIRNARSQAAIAKLGARCEGVLRRYQRRQDGTVRDSVVFSVTAEDWPAVKSGLEERLR